jgi:hypothetical protein
LKGVEVKKEGMALCGDHVSDFKFLHLLISSVMQADVVAEENIFHNTHEFVASGLVVAGDKSFSSHTLFS